MVQGSERAALWKVVHSYGHSTWKPKQRSPVQEMEMTTARMRRMWRMSFEMDRWGKHEEARRLRYDLASKATNAELRALLLLSVPRPERMPA